MIKYMLYPYVPLFRDISKNLQSSVNRYTKAVLWVFFVFCIKVHCLFQLVPLVESSREVRLKSFKKIGLLAAFFMMLGQELTDTAQRTISISSFESCKNKLGILCFYVPIIVHTIASWCPEGLVAKIPALRHQLSAYDTLTEY